MAAACCVAAVGAPKRMRQKKKEGNFFSGIVEIRKPLPNVNLAVRICRFWKCVLLIVGKKKSTTKAGVANYVI